MERGNRPGRKVWRRRAVREKYGDQPGMKEGKKIVKSEGYFGDIKKETMNKGNVKVLRRKNGKPARRGVTERNGKGVKV